MSWNPTIEPHCPDASTMDAIETIIVPRARDIDVFERFGSLPTFHVGRSF